MAKNILVGLGANLPSDRGGPQATIQAAVQRLAQNAIEIQAVSAVYRTAPVPASDQPDFINIALAARTALSAQQLLHLFQNIERQLGRQPAERWSARTLDIDLLAYGSHVLPSASAWHDVAYSDDPAAILAEPVVPHPRLHKRAFVLKPLMDIAADWDHPVLHKTVKQLMVNEDVAAQVASVVQICVDL
ncbi:MAG: 2-amino-4-hydroxy-6-hydroxymethyldihydropteridine diphosphokinase [Kordiimonadaceae bacterium]|nr:2-amino-4-hydroxy-6-hydroxymethyldihydropteridine diphosphokinase [Kordiimonadaceae bacterium]